MAQTHINSTIILNESLALLSTKCKSLNAVYRGYDKRFGDNATLKPGTSLQVRKPVQFVVNTGKKLTIRDTVEESVTVSCTDQLHVAMPAFTSEQKAMNLVEFKRLYLEPAMSALSAKLDAKVLQYAAETFYSFVGTPGTTPASDEVLLMAGEKLHNNNVSEENRFALINPAANRAITHGLVALFNPNKTLSDQYDSGFVQNSLGLNIGMTNNVYRLTCGTRSGSNIACDDAGGTTLAEGTSMIHIDGLGGATETIKKGEKFTISGVYAVTPESKINTGSLMQFTVTQDFVGSGSEGDLYFSPAIRASTSDGRQNVNALPVNSTSGNGTGNGVLTFLGTASTAYPYNIVMHKDALTLVTADLPVPRGTNEARRDVLNGISMRYIEDYDAINDEWISRFDVFCGVSALRAESGVVMYG